MKVNISNNSMSAQELTIEIIPGACCSCSSGCTSSSSSCCCC